MKATAWTTQRAATAQVHRAPTSSSGELGIALSAVGGPDSISGGPPTGENDSKESRIAALVDLACDGDPEAFGQLYDHYLPGLYRFVLSRVRSRALAEDLTSETFTRALRSIGKFHWQGTEFGAWLTTIARNLIADHFKCSRSRLEIVAEEVPERRAVEDGPEDEVLDAVMSDRLMVAVRTLPAEQRDCLLMRFVQELSIAQTAEALGRSEGAVKQLQLRAVRRLAREMAADVET